MNLTELHRYTDLLVICTCIRTNTQEKKTMTIILNLELLGVCKYQTIG